MRIMTTWWLSKWTGAEYQASFDKSVAGRWAAKRAPRSAVPGRQLGRSWWAATVASACHLTISAPHDLHAALTTLRAGYEFSRMHYIGGYIGLALGFVVSRITSQSPAGRPGRGLGSVWRPHQLPLASAPHPLASAA